MEPKSIDNRPGGWWERVNDVYIPMEGDKLLINIMTSLANTQSYRSKLRIAGYSSEEEKQVLRHAAERIQRFHGLLKASQDTSTDAKALSG